MNKYKVIKWILFSIIFIAFVISITFISLYSISFFNYTYLFLATIALILTIQYVFKQKEDSDYIDDEIKEEVEK